MPSNLEARRPRPRPLLLWTATLLLSAAFLFSGAGKLAGQMDGPLTGLGVPAWSIPIIGLVEVCAAAVLCVPRAATYAAATLAVVMVGAVGTHLAAGDAVGWLAPFLLGLLAFAVAWGRRDARFRLAPPMAPATA